MDCSPPGFSVHGISQTRILDWVAMPSSRGSSWPRNGTCISCLPGGFFIAEPPGKHLFPWNFPSKNTGVGCSALLQGIFPTQGLNACLQCLLHWQVDSLPPCHLGSPYINIMLFDKRQEEETTKSQQAVTLCSGQSNGIVETITAHQTHQAIMRPRTQGLILSRHLPSASTAHTCTELSSLLRAFTDTTF